MMVVTSGELILKWLKRLTYGALVWSSSEFTCPFRH